METTTGRATARTTGNEVADEFPVRAGRLPLEPLDGVIDPAHGVEHVNNAF